MNRLRIRKKEGKVELVFKRLSEGRDFRTQSAINNCKDQARRTAWKILYEWVQIQVSMIQIEQVEIMEVFLPYAYDKEKNETYFEKIKANGFKQLQLTN